MLVDSKGFFMAEFRKSHPLIYCVLAAAVGLGGMVLVYQLWDMGVDAGVLAGIDTALPRLGPTLVKLIPAVLAFILLRATGRLGLLGRTSGFGRGIATGSFLLAYAAVLVAMGFSRLAEGNGTVPDAGRACAFVSNFFLVGLGEELLVRGVMAETLLEHFGLERRGILAACGLSGLVFGLMHLVNLIQDPASSVVPQVVAAAFAGILLAAIYFRSGNIWANVVLHMLFDMGGALSALFKSAAAAGPDIDPVATQALSFVMPMVLGIILGCVALFVLRKKKLPQVQEAWAGVL